MSTTGVVADFLPGKHPLFCRPGLPSTGAGEKPVSPPVAAVDLKSRTSRVNGLLDGGKMAGATSQMNVWWRFRRPAWPKLPWAVRDFFPTEGPQALMSINVFALMEFDQARDLAMTTRPAALTTALAEFDKIIKSAPAKEKAPADSSLSGIKKDGLDDAVYRLKRSRTRMHPETRPLLDSMEAFSRQVRAFVASPPRSATLFNRAAQGISSAGSLVDENFKSLRANPEVMAELMKE